MNCELRYNEKRNLSYGKTEGKKLSQVQNNNKRGRWQSFKERVIIFLLLSAFALIFLSDFIFMMR